MADETPLQRIKRLLEEWDRDHPGTVVRQGESLGPEGDALTELLREELQAQIWIKRLGEIDPTEQQVGETAYLLAEVLTRVYRFERREPSESN